MRRAAAWIAVAVSVAGAPGAGAQPLGSRVAQVRDGAVSFHFGARPGVCGDGLRYVRVGSSSYMGTWSDGRGPCIDGPVQVRMVLRGGAVERIESWVGPLRDRDARPLGAVGAAEAASYLMSLVAAEDSPAAAKAILPAVLADSSVTWPALLAIARDGERVRAVRQDALHWLSRFAGNAIAGRSNDPLSRDDASNSADHDLKTHAVFVASQLPRHEAVPLLIQLARSDREVPVRQSALFWLGQSGDPRAVDVFASILRGR